MVSINTNVASLLAQNNTRQVNNELESAMERLSSGLRINSASDDAAGLAISSRMESQVRGLQAAIKNANDGISVTQVAEGAMEEIGNILQRMRELSVQSANDSNSDTDRAYLQGEVSQLSDEISRIASTTQFNGVNVLDGSFSNKSFQIGANANQNVSLSISDVGASSLGIGSSSTSSTTTSSTSTNGVAEEIGSLSFNANDTYSFQVTDQDTGLSYRIGSASGGVSTAQTVTAVSTAAQTFTLADHGFRTGDRFTASANAALGSANTLFIVKIDDDTFQAATSLGNALNGTVIDPVNASAPNVTGVGMVLTVGDAQSRADFAERINIGLKESATNTSIDAFATAASVSATTLAASTADDDLFKFNLTVDGVSSEVDIKQRVLANASDATAVTYTELKNSMREAIQSVFDDSVSVTVSSGRFSVEDAQGRSLAISQGNGSGYFFGTDEQNNGTMSVDGNIQNNVSVAWNEAGTDLVFNHAAAGEMTISNYDSVSTGIATFDIADTATTSLTDPVALQEDSVFDSTASAKGQVGESKVALNFSNTFGYAEDSGSGASDANLVATYVFKVTDGAGNVYMDFSGTSSALDIQRLNNSDAAIKTFVENNLSANFATFGDTRIGADEFEIDYSNGVLSITNTEGRDLAIEDFSSSYGSVTVSKLDALGGTEELASQQALASEIRIARGYGTSITAGTANLVFKIDGGTAVSADVSGAFLGTTATDTGWEQAALIEDALLASSATGGVYVRVAYDSENDQFVINDTLGRSIELVSTEVANTGEYFVEEAVFGAANKANSVLTDSETTSGVLTEATKVTLTANQDNMAALVIGLNGVTSTAATFNFDSDTLAGSDLKANLDTMVESLNANYNGAAISYEVDVANRAITFTHAKGGELFFDGHTTTSTDLEFAITVDSGDLASASQTNDSGQAVIKAYEATTTVTAEGDGEVDYTTSSSSSSSSSTSSTGIDQISIATATGATSAIDSIDAALNSILSERAKLGALENRLDHTVNNLSNVSTNTSAALSRILDADFAKETTALTKSQILSQAATSMLAQANQSKQSILALLQ